MSPKHEASHSNGKLLTVHIARQFQADKTSSRTKSSLIMAGRSGPSKWARAASGIVASKSLPILSFNVRTVTERGSFEAAVDRFHNLKYDLMHRT